jgi:sterol desaturase/sphingolipid hydroxylase (fatty acid hydroxylase superfamily)
MGVNMPVCNNGGIQLASDKQNNMMTATEINPEKKRFPFREIGWITLTGVGGNALVFLFLITFLHFLVAFKYVPWIIAFNTAVSGYALVDKTRNLIHHKKLLAALVGAVITSVTCGLLTLLSFYFMRENFLAIQDVVFFHVIGVIGSGLGALLGIKYFKLK